MTITLNAAQLIAGIVALAGFLGALGYLGHLALRGLRWVQTIGHLVDQELTNDHGSSMKDDLHGVAVAVGRLSRDFDDLKAAFYRHLERNTDR